MIDPKQNGNSPINPTGSDQTGTGLTKREYFAAMSMQGILSNPDTIMEFWPDRVDSVADGSVRLADALLKELSKDPNNDR